MRTGTPAILLTSPAAAGLGNRGVPGYPEESIGGRRVGADPVPTVRAAAFAKAGRALVNARGRTLHRRTADRARAGWRPTRAERDAVSAVQRSD
jgi:hypothetical protein